MQTQFTKGSISTEVVEKLDATRYGVRAWYQDLYLGVDWFNSEKEAKNEARRLVNVHSSQG